MDTSWTKQHARGFLSAKLKRLQAAALVIVAASLVASTARAEIDYSSQVDATVTPPPPATGGLYLYEFEVFNTSPRGESTAAFAALVEPEPDSTPVIIDFELPLFSLSDIDVNSVDSPDGWNFQILQSPYPVTLWNYDSASDPLLFVDPGLYGPNPQVFNNPPLVLHWYLILESGGSPIFPGDSLAGFSFESPYSQQNAPYLASWDFLPPRGGDPPIPGQGFGTPNSPTRQAFQQAVPEPSSMVLFTLGATALLGGNIFRRRRSLRGT